MASQGRGKTQAQGIGGTAQDRRKAMPDKSRDNGGTKEGMRMDEINEIRVQAAINAVARVFRFSEQRMIEPGRQRNDKYAKARFAVIFLLRENRAFGQIDCREIGEFLGGRDQSTIRYGFERAKYLFDSDDEFIVNVLFARQIMRRVISDRIKDGRLVMLAHVSPQGVKETIRKFPLNDVGMAVKVRHKTKKPMQPLWPESLSYEGENIKCT